MSDINLTVNDEKNIQYKKDILIGGQLITTLFCTYSNNGNTVAQNFINNQKLYEKYFEEIVKISTEFKEEVKSDLNKIGLKVMFL